MKIKYVALALLLTVFMLPHDASAAWWNTTWQACSNITITNNGGALTNFPTFINFSLQSNQSDFMDVVYVDTSCNNGGNALYSWTMNRTSNYTLDWVNVSSIAGGSSNISAYYNSTSNIGLDWRNASRVWDYADDMNTTNGWVYDTALGGVACNQADAFTGGYFHISGTSTGTGYNCGRTKNIGLGNLSAGWRGIISFNSSGVKANGAGDYILTADTFSASNNWAYIYNNALLYPGTGTSHSFGYANKPSFYNIFFASNSTNGINITVYNTSSNAPYQLISSPEARNQATNANFSMSLGADNSDNVNIYFNYIYISNKTASYEPTYMISPPQTTALIIVPAYSNINVFPASPQSYPTTNITFNITWNSSQAAQGLSQVWISHNFTGSFADYQMSNTTPAANNTDANYTYVFNTTAAASTYAYTFYANDTAGALNNTGQSAYTITKAVVLNTLSSSAGFNIQQGVQTTIGCANSQGLATTLTQNGITIANPLTAALSFGSYSFICSQNTHQNYTSSAVSNTLNVLTAGAGCINQTDYIYAAIIPASGSQIVLNFTTLASQNVVKNDLSDVNVSTSNISYSTNFTGGNYFMVDSSNVSSFTISFGNYFANNSYVNSTRTNATATNFSYNQSASYYYTANLLNEIDASFLYPIPNATATISTNCANGANLYNITQHTIMFPTMQQLNSSRITVTYNPTNVYYRELLVASPITFLNFYLADATQYQVVQFILTLQDNTGTFTNPYLAITKTLGGQSITIDSLYFDIEKKAIVYLVNGGIYIVGVTSGSDTRVLGDLFIDNVNLQKTLTIGALVPTAVEQGNVSYSLTYDAAATALTFIWHDSSALTRSINMSVYNKTSGLLLATFSSTNMTTTQFTYIIPNINSTYIVNVTYAHNIFGGNSLPGVITWIWNAGGAFFLPLIASPFIFPAFDLAIKQAAAGITIIIMVMFFDAATGYLGAIIASIAAIGFAYIGWWGIGGAVGVVALILAILGHFGSKRRNDMS